MAKQIPKVPILYPDSMGVELNPSHYVAPQPIIEFKALEPDYVHWQEWQAWLKKETKVAWRKRMKGVK